VPALFQRDGFVRRCGYASDVKFHQKLFCSYYRNVQEVQLYKGEFADDIVLLVCSTATQVMLMLLTRLD